MTTKHLVLCVLISLVCLFYSRPVPAQFLGNIGSTTVTACGSTPSGSVIGDNTKGVITVGGGVVTGCTLTFSHTLSVTPACIFTPSGLVMVSGTFSTSAATIGLSATLGGGKIAYWCFDPTARF
jgi:hypothetical protein